MGMYSYYQKIIFDSVHFTWHHKVPPEAFKLTWEQIFELIDINVHCLNVEIQQNFCIPSMGMYSYYQKIIFDSVHFTWHHKVPPEALKLTWELISHYVIHFERKKM